MNDVEQNKQDRFRRHGMRFDPVLNWGHVFTILAIIIGGGTVAISMKTDIAVLQSQFSYLQTEVSLIRETMQKIERK